MTQTNTRKIGRITAFVAVLIANTGCEVRSSCPDGVLLDPASTGTVEPKMDVQVETFEGFEVLYSVHPEQEPRALLFVFHGASGDARFVEKTDVTEALNLFTDNGIAFVSTTSTQRKGEQKWDNTTFTTSNRDWGRLTRLRDHLIETTTVTKSTPILATGLSNGASYSAVFVDLAQSAGWPVRGAALHNSGIYGALGTRGVALPIFFVAAENDTIVPGTVVWNSWESQEEKGYDAWIREMCEVRLNPHRFARLPEINNEGSEALFDDLVAEGIIDKNGDRTIATDAIERTLKGFFQARPDLPDDAQTQIRTAWAMHKYDGHFAPDVLRFFDSVLE